MAGLAGMKLGGCELLEEIGQGGMGLIYKARQLSLDRIVAVKILAEHLAHNPSFVERFQREARAIAKINHANILAVYDVGAQEGRHFMIMELVDGGSVAEELEARGVLGAWEGTEIVLQSARGLECAAAANIIHRDVKPDNIMLTSRRVVKVSDFGLAKELDSAMTETQAVMGTPAYMSPEQCDGRDLDSRTDIYSLGGTFYRCVTGRLPFEAETAMSMMYRHKHVPLVPPLQIIPTLPPVLSEIICRMMAKDRDERFQSMAEVVQSLEAAQKAAGAVADLGKTMPVPPPEGASVSSVNVPGSDSRVVAPPPSRQQVEDTAVRCRRSAQELSAQGKFAQAARELRRLLEVSPDDAEARAALRDIERRASEKRMAGTEIRTLISSGHYEEALSKWKALDADVRDEQLTKQVTHLESAVVPALKLVAQADSAAGAGRLEEAAGIYQQALELDPASEKAKQGLKNLERTRQRIDFLLKEGYGHRQNRDYAQAVAVWDKILAVEPTHGQARRLIVEAHLAAAAEAYADEEFDKAATHYEALLKIEPNHEEARKALAEATLKRDRVAELRKTAQLAKSKGDLAASAQAWENLVAILPTNRLARDGLAAARRALSARRLKRFGGTLAAVIVLAGGTVVWQEWSTLNKARAAKEAAQFERAVGLASRIWLPGLKGEAQEIVQKAGMLALRQKAEKHASEGRWIEARDAMALVIKSCGSGPVPADYQEKLNQYNYEASLQLAAEAEKRGDWRKAQSHHIDVGRFATALGMREAAAQAESDGRFCALFADGLDEEAAKTLDWQTRAKNNYNRAKLCRQKAEGFRKKSLEALEKKLQALGGGVE